MGFLTDAIGALSGAQAGPLNGQQMEGIATSDDPNSTATQPGDTISDQPQTFAQKHPVAHAILQGLAGRPVLPQGSPQAPTAPTVAQPATQQPAGNAATAPSGNAALAGVIQAMTNPVSSQKTPFNSTLNGLGVI
jgi:hypothetical protein